MLIFKPTYTRDPERKPKPKFKQIFILPKGATDEDKKKKRKKRKKRKKNLKKKTKKEYNNII